MSKINLLKLISLCLFFSIMSCNNLKSKKENEDKQETNSVSSYKDKEKEFTKEEIRSLNAVEIDSFIKAFSNKEEAFESFLKKAINYLEYLDLDLIKLSFGQKFVMRIKSLLYQKQNKDVGYYIDDVKINQIKIDSNLSSEVIGFGYTEAVWDDSISNAKKDWLDWEKGLIDKIPQEDLLALLSYFADNLSTGNNNLKDEKRDDFVSINNSYFRNREWNETESSGGFSSEDEYYKSDGLIGLYIANSSLLTNWDIIESGEYNNLNISHYDFNSNFIYLDMENGNKLMATLQVLKSIVYFNNQKVIMKNTLESF